MLITRTSMISGIKRTIDIPVTEEQLQSWQNGSMVIQAAMPNLTPDQREFILTGVTADEWDAAFPDED